MSDKKRQEIFRNFASATSLHTRDNKKKLRHLSPGNQRLSNNTSKDYLMQVPRT